MFSMKHISRAKLSKKEHLKKITIVKKFVNWCSLIELKNSEIALNILFVDHNQKEIRRTYISKYKIQRKNEINLLMITDAEK